MSCPSCILGSFLPGEPKGRTLPNGAYFAPGPSSSHNSHDDLTLNAPNALAEELEEAHDRKTRKRAIVYLTDAFGLPLVNCKILADTLAERVGCDVYVPDYFAGRPQFGLHDLEPNGMAEQQSGFVFWAKWLWAAFPHIPDFIANRASVLDARLDIFIKELKEEKKYDKIGAVGYCIGGSTVVRLGSKPHFVDSIVVCHPGPVTPQECDDIKVPASWVCPEVDFAFPTSKRLAAEASFVKRQAGKDPVPVDYEFVDYKDGAYHGFACRPNLENPKIKDAFERSVDQTVRWFQKTLV